MTRVDLVASGEVMLFVQVKDQGFVKTTFVRQRLSFLFTLARRLKRLRWFAAGTTQLGS